LYAEYAPVKAAENGVTPRTSTQGARAAG
jgi:hypothetical protein